MTDSQKEAIDSDIYFLLIRLTQALHQMGTLNAIFSEESDGIILE